MKAAVFYGKHDLRIEEINKPVPGADEVLIKVMACGICGTDVHIFEGDEGAAATPAGTVLGHEFSGMVEAIGSRVRHIKPGDRVCVDPNKLCGACRFCRSGVGHFCEQMTGIGTTVNGGFAEYCAVPESQALKIADSTTFDEAAMAEPVSCCLHGIELCHIEYSDNVVIIGCGMIGMLMTELAKLSGAARVAVIEPDTGKRAMAIKLGAELAIDPAVQKADEVLAAHGFENIDKVIECAGLVSTMEEAVRLAGKKATVMLFGLTAPGAVMQLKPFEVFKKELEIKASYINPYTEEKAIKLIDSRRIDVSSMIYGKLPLDRLPSLLADKAQRRLGKYIVNPNEN